MSNYLPIILFGALIVMSGWAITQYITPAPTMDKELEQQWMICGYMWRDAEAFFELELMFDEMYDSCDDIVGDWSGMFKLNTCDGCEEV